MASEAAPEFVREDSLLRDAYELARAAHHGSRRQGETNVDHPIQVAELLASSGFDSDIVAAALLHDVVEDTDTDLSELAARFGERVCELVREMTEDQSIEPYTDRKAEHRDRITKSRPVAAIYAADKLANARHMEGPQDVSAERLAHYFETLKVLRRDHPDLPFLPDLRHELDRISDAGTAERGD